jgi:hypothetical protein
MPQHPRFGTLVGQHPGRFGAGGWLWYVGAILLAAGGMHIGQGAGLLAPTEGDGDLQTKVIMGLAGLVIGALVLLTAIMRWQQSVAVYERGLVYTKLFGSVEIAFAEVTNVQHIRTHSRLGTSDSLEVTLQSGAEVTIGSVTGIEQLASMLRSAPR